MKLLGYTFQRILAAIPTLAAIILITFIISRVLPTDPAALMAGPFATEETIAKLQAEHGLNEPYYKQLLIYYKNVLTGDLGESLFTHREITWDILHRFPATLELTLFSLGWSVLLGIPLGVITALKRNTWLDHVARAITIAGIATAAFWLAIMLQIALGWKLNLFPVHGRLGVPAPPSYTGLVVVDSLLAWNFTAFTNTLYHLVLPSLSLGFAGFATIVRFCRAGVLDALESEYVNYARAMGLPRRLLIYKYVLRNAITSTLTQIGLLFGFMLGGSIVVEVVFDWPGMGVYALESILSSDYNAVLGVALWIGIAFITGNLIVDILLRLIDPRKVSE